ncbi:MAG: hypothetical protein KKF56_02120 [Nanoarchaeota archaeon]|nr:hypothetical protein [Nanoarchaeota archaeon]
MDKQKIKESINLVKFILKNKKYQWIFWITVFLTFGALYFFMVATTAGYSLKIFIMMNGLWFAYISILSFMFIAWFFGIFVVLMVFKISSICKSYNGGGILGIIGAIAAAFGAGCPMCGAFIFGLIGMPLALMSFPYHGLELRIASVFLLLISDYLMTRGLISCKVIFKREGDK